MHELIDRYLACWNETDSTTGVGFLDKVPT